MTLRLLVPRLSKPAESVLVEMEDIGTAQPWKSPKGVRFPAYTTTFRFASMVVHSQIRTKVLNKKPNPVMFRAAQDRRVLRVYDLDLARCRLEEG